jgi:hypothetical protein
MPRTLPRIYWAAWWGTIVLLTVKISVESTLRYITGSQPAPEPIVANAFATPFLVVHCVPGHTARIEYFPHGHTDDPDCPPEYAVSLSDDRPLSSWLLLERDLQAYLRGGASKG